MSIPVSFCLISKAARGDGAAYARLLGYMRVNAECGHWSQFPCGHDPRCPRPTDEQVSALDARLVADLAKPAGEELT